MADVLFKDLLPGARFMIEVDLNSITPVTGERVCSLLDSATGTAGGTTVISPATGTTSGHVDTPATFTVRALKQVFLPGDIVRHVDGRTAVVLSTSVDNTLVFDRPDQNEGIPSADVRKVGHVDPATLI